MRIKLWIKILILPILAIIFFILLYNGFIFERIRHMINSRYELKVDKIDGNLFTSLELRGVKFRKVFSAPYISISYTPWSIMRKHIKRVKIESPIFEIGTTGYTMITPPFSVGNFILQKGKILNVSKVQEIDSLELQGSLKKKGLDITHGNAIFKFREKLIKIDKVKGSISLDNELIKITELSADVHGAEIKALGMIKRDSLEIKFCASDFPIDGVVENVTGKVNADITLKRSIIASKVTPDTLISADGTVELKNGKYKGQSMGDIITHIALVNNDLKLKIKEWKLGKMSFYGNTYIDLASFPLLSYRAILTGEQIDLSTSAVTKLALPTNLSGKIKIEGKGSEFHAAIDLSGKVKDFVLNSIQAQINYMPGKIEVLSFKGIHKEGEVFATGNISRKDINLSLSGRDIALGLFFTQFSGISNFDLTLNGPIEMPSVAGTFYIKDFKSGKFTSKYLSGNLNLTKLFPPVGEGEIESANLRFYKNEFDVIKATIATTGEHSTYELTAHGESMDLNLKGVGYGENLIIHTLSLISPTLRLSNAKDINIQFNQNKLNIKSCHLLANDSLIQVEGWISKDKSALAIVGKNLALHSFSDAINGSVYFTCNIRGALKSPVISVVSDITNFSFSRISADKISLSLLYQDQLLHIKKGELNRGVGTAKISGYLPMKLPFEILDNPIDLQVRFSNFGEDIFLPYHKFVELNGSNLNGNFIVKGSGKHPIVYGNMSFSGESINAKFLGTTLTSPKAELNFEGNKITIKALEAKTSSGFLKIAGNACLPDELNFDIYAKGLTVRSIEDVDAKLSTNLTLKGSVKNPTVIGNIKVEEAVITTPFQKRTTINLRSPINYDLSVEFPDKVWIRNTMVDAELEGEIKVRKEKDNFFLAGDAKMKGGYFYYYVGPPFKIERGEFRFMNSPELNPQIDLSAFSVISYTVPDTMTNKDSTFTDTIYLQVNGRMREPKLTLSSQPPMPLEDIISLLSLNMRADELLKLQEFEYQKALGVGAKALSHYLLIEKGRLEKLKSQMGVDALRMEEIMVGEEMRARFNIGKYVRKDLYVSYTNDLFSLSKYNFKAEYSPWKYGSFVGETEEGKLKAGVQFKIRY